MNMATWLARMAAAAPERGAVFLGTEVVASYGALHAAARALAGGLRARGVATGDRVALFMKNVPDYLTALYGIWYAGAAAVPVNARLHPREVAWILDNAGASLCVATPGLAGDLSDVTAVRVVEAGGPDWQALLASDPLAAPEQRAAADLAWLFYTSGTTGRPKGVIITHRMLVLMALSFGWDVLPVTAADAAIYAAPMSHGAGLYHAMHMRAGARHVFPVTGGFAPDEVLDLAEAHGRAHLFMAPTMVQRFTAQARAEGRGGHGLRTIVYAGGPMYQSDVIAAVEQFGPVFAQIYGQGECPMGITALTHAEVADRNHPDWRARLNSVGRAQSAVELRVADAEGQPLPPGEIGEILVRGDLVMPGYWRNPEASARALQGGWLWTGDMGVLDAAGYLTLKDRSRDMIISGGTNIYPREVEEALLEHPSVREAAVVGRPHPEWGEEVVAFVVTDGPLDDAALDAFCMDRIARFKRPRVYVDVKSLPKNNYGKVLKTDLRERLAASS